MIENNIFSGICNRELYPSFVSGYTGPGEAEESSRLESRLNFNPGDAGQAFALLCAEVLKLKMGVSVCIGSLPPQTKEGFAVVLHPDDPGMLCDYCFGRITLAGRSADRGKLLLQCEKLLLALPCFKWLTVNSSLQQNAVTFCRIEPAGRGRELSANGGGIRGYGMELDFSFCICVTPPAAEIY